MEQTFEGDKKVAEQSLSAHEYALIQELVQSRRANHQKIEYESFDGYELPPRTQFSMLKKPAVSIKYGKMVFNMACVRLFEGIQYILPIVNSSKKRIAIIPCAEEESASVEWARYKEKDQLWVNKDITSVDFLEKIFELMGWNRECRYKVLGRVAASDRGVILVFDLEEAIMFEPKKEEYTDPVTGELKKRQVKYYPDAYKNRIGRSYNDYAQYRQVNMFEDFADYAADQATAVSVDAPSNGNEVSPVTGSIHSFDNGNDGQQSLNYGGESL